MSNWIVTLLGKRSSICRSSPGGNHLSMSILLFSVLGFCATVLCRNWSFAVNILGDVVTTQEVVLKTKDGLLQTEDILLTTKEGLLQTEDVLLTTKDSLLTTIPNQMNFSVRRVLYPSQNIFFKMVNVSGIVSHLTFTFPDHFYINVKLYRLISLFILIFLYIFVWEFLRRMLHL